VRGSLLAATALALIAGASSASAQGDGEPPRGFLLELTSPGAPIGSPPVVQVTSADGEVVELRPRDDGVPPDATGGDEIYTAHVPSFSGAKVSLAITAGEATWGTSLALDAGTPFSRVTVELATDGTAVATPITGGPDGQPPPAGGGDPGPGDGGDPGPGGGGTPGGADPVPGGGDDSRPDPRAPGSQPIVPDRSTAAAPAEAADRPSSFAPGLALWAVLFALLGTGLALVPSWLGRRNRGPATLDPPPPPGTVAPISLAADDVGSALAGPLADHRVVVLGPVPEGSRGLILCREPAPLPDELVAAVEGVAAAEGPRPALLVTDASLLDRPGRRPPLEALADAVAGRFPLFVVDGPNEWSSWAAPEDTP